MAEEARQDSAIVLGARVEGKSTLGPDDPASIPSDGEPDAEGVRGPGSEVSGEVSYAWGWDVGVVDCSVVTMYAVNHEGVYRLQGYQVLGRVRPRSTAKRWARIVLHILQSRAKQQTQPGAAGSCANPLQWGAAKVRLLQGYALGVLELGSHQRWRKAAQEINQDQVVGVATPEQLSKWISRFVS